MFRTTRSFGIVLFVLALFVSTFAVFADDSLTLNTGKKNINVRSGPGIEYAIRGVARPETTLTVTGRNDFEVTRVCRGLDSDNEMWLRVQFGTLEGWIARCTVTVTGDVATLAVVTPSNPQMAETEPLKKLYAPMSNLDKTKFVGHTGENVVLHASASLNGDVLGVISSGKPVYVIGRTEDGSWVKIEYGEYTGWVTRHLMILGYKWMDVTPVK